MKYYDQNIKIINKKDKSEHILKEIMFGKSKESIDKQILDFKNSLKTMDWKRILKPTGLKKLNEYVFEENLNPKLFHFANNDANLADYKKELKDIFEESDYSFNIIKKE